MSESSFIVLLLTMWAVVAALFTAIFSVGSGAGPLPKEEETPRPTVRVRKPKLEHHLPHAA
jgi:hypothetical protein